MNETLSLDKEAGRQVAHTPPSLVNQSKFHALELENNGSQAANGLSQIRQPLGL